MHDPAKPPTCELQTLAGLPVCIERLVQNYRDLTQAESFDWIARGPARVTNTELSYLDER